MRVLPLIDLSLLAGWTSLFVGFLLKALALTTSYRPAVLSLTSIDFLMIGIAALLFAIALAARSWVKSQDPSVTAHQRQRDTLDAWDALPRVEAVMDELPGEAVAATKQASAAS